MQQMISCPDFLGIGAPRCGTTFLFKQLVTHDKIWIPSIKEIHYFDNQRGRSFLNKRNLKHIKYSVGTMLGLKILWYLWKKKTVQFGKYPYEILFSIKYLFGPRTDEWYFSLFPKKSGVLTGEITPSYQKLSEELVAIIAKNSPNLKIFYLMRDPIERAWSHVVYDQAKRKKRHISMVNEKIIFDRLNGEAISLASNYLANIKKWQKYFPKENIFIGFLEDIIENPIDFMVSVYNFLEIGPNQKQNIRSLSNKVNDTDKFKTDIPDHIERFLAEKFSEMTKILAGKYGGRTIEYYEHIRKILDS